MIASVHTRMGVYNEIVIGPYASRGQCVVAHKTDFAVMAHHALLSSYSETGY